jgi:hypothetical protein
MKLIHLIKDEKAISRLAPNLARLKGVENKYVVLNEKKDTKFKHISDIELWRIVGREYLNSSLMKEDLIWADALVVHYLQPLAAEIVLRTPTDVVIVWSGWGGDYYSLLPGGSETLISVETSRLIDTNNNRGFLFIAKHQIDRLSITRIIQSAKFRIRNKVLLLKSYEQIKDEFIERVDFFSAPISDDYVLLKNALGKKFRAEYLQLNYASLEQVTKSWNVQLSGNDILLGNSATPTNNHAEMLMMLSKLDLGDRKVIVPLSYGDESYANQVIDLGNSLLGSHFYPVREFMPIGEYNKLLSTCSVAIMNHRRQQAMGNAVIMLYLGAKLFLDKDGVIYNFFTKRGALVYPIQELKEIGESSFKSLSDEERLINRNVLESMWGEEVVMKNYIEFIEKLERHRSGNA